MLRLREPARFARLRAEHLACRAELQRTLCEAAELPMAEYKATVATLRELDDVSRWFDPEGLEPAPLEVGCGV